MTDPRPATGPPSRSGVRRFGDRYQDLIAWRRRCGSSSAADLVPAQPPLAVRGQYLGVPPRLGLARFVCVVVGLR
jgi:hypothetical protein